MSALGAMTRDATDFYSSNMNNILQGKEGSGIRRLLCVSAAATDPGGFQRWTVKPILWHFYGGMYADLPRMEGAVKARDLDWTILRLPQLSDGPRTRRYKVAINRHLALGRSINRADVADFIVGHLSDRETYGTTVELAK